MERLIGLGLIIFGLYLMKQGKKISLLVYIIGASLLTH